ncbi:MAG TPA: hypothetical protein IAB45_03410 [Candidatus Onthousia faecavium]|nr:hypothetical protein [Candidatus Onthousia faecavium]
MSNEMYDYLNEHNYISRNKNKDPLKQQELSKERADAIANKYEQLVKELKQENQELKQKINTYENPNDLTLMFMYCNEKARDMIEELKKELKEKDDFINKLQATKDRLDKYDYERTNQQKEFIEYLECEIDYWGKQKEEWIKLGFVKIGGEACFEIIYRKILSKYKEITGIKNE